MNRILTSKPRRPGVRLLAFAALMAVAAASAHAAGIEDILFAVTRPSATQKSFFAVIDVKTDRGADAVAAATLFGVRRYANGAALNQSMAKYGESTFSVACTTRN